MAPSSSLPLTTNPSLPSFPFLFNSRFSCFFSSSPLPPNSCTHLTLLYSSSKHFKDIFLSVLAVNFLFLLMEGATLGLLSGGGGGSGGSINESIVSKVHVVEQDQYVNSTSYPAEGELELGLGLSLGVGGCGGGGKGKASAWGEYGRILTAKDFPSVLSHAHRGANASGSCGAAVTGTKRAAADSSPQEGGSPTGGRFDYD